MPARAEASVLDYAERSRGCTAREYPWINVQIIPFPKEQHGESIAKIKAQPTISWVIEHPGRRDFAAPSWR